MLGKRLANVTAAVSQGRGKMKDRSCMPVNRSHRGELENQVVLEIRREGEELSQLEDERWEPVR